MKLIFKAAATVAAITLLSGCDCCRSGIRLLPQENFTATIDGKPVCLYTLKGGDVTMQVTNFGARVISIWTPDRNGRYADVSTGYENLDRYVNNTGERFLGASIGPVGNRIGHCTYTLEGEKVTLPDNNNGNTLHGGLKGVDMLVWDVAEISDSSIVFALAREEGLDGWPGELDILMSYALTCDNEFVISYQASVSKPMPVNLTNHTFFNLTGDSSKSILDHELQIFASRTTPVDSLLIPLGTVTSVEGSAFDFREPKAIGRDINADDEQIRFGGGFDHNWCLDSEDGLHTAAVVYEPESGRTLEVITDQPGLQFYAGNFFNGEYNDKYGKPIGWRCSLALETQKWPDSINHEGFTETVVRPGETYTHKCIYKFGVRK